MHLRTHAVVVSVATASLAALALSGCGSSTGSADTAASPAASTASGAAESPSGSSPATSTAQATTVKITLTGSKVSPALDTLKVAKGTPVRITVTRDSSGEVHVHGYEFEEQLNAGEPFTFDFVADQQGVFDVEAHSPDVLLLKLQVN